MLPHFDLPQMIRAVGYPGLFAIVFAESGLFFGFFLPGDSLLFTAGLLAAQGWFSIWVLIPLLIVAAVLGDNVGYWTGSRFGQWLLNRKESWFFSKSHLIMAEQFYEKHGGKAIILARFMPAVRTFAPIVAGIARMHYRSFAFFNIAGGVFWVLSVTLCGYFLGTVLPDPEKFLLPVVGIIVVVSVLPGLLHLRKKPEAPLIEQISE